MSNDPYATLGVSKGADEKAIRSAYRKLAKDYHPDRNQGNAQAEERFKAIGAAYAILGDKEKRARFDRGEIDASGQERAPFGAGGFGGGPGGGFRGARGQAGGFDQEDLSAFFSDMFSGGGFQGDFHPGGAGGAGRRAPARGADRSYRLAISFEDAILGTTSRVTLPEGGSLDVKIPPGIEDGQTLRLRGKGSPGRRGPSGQAGPSGDALIEIAVSPSTLYTRDGTTVRATVPVGLKVAVLGGKLTVPTPKGSVTMTVPKHSDSGTVLRLAGRGVGAHGSTPAGDLYVTLQVQLGAIEPELEAFLAGREKAAS